MVFGVQHTVSKDFTTTKMFNFPRICGMIACTMLSPDDDSPRIDYVVTTNQGEIHRSNLAVRKMHVWLHKNIGFLMCVNTEHTAVQE